MDTLKARIKQLRHEKGLTQEELAKQIGTTRATLASWEIGRREPDTETLNKLASFFNVTVDYLLGRTDVRNPDRPWQPVITPKDEKDIAKDLERIMNDLSQADGLMFYNEPMTDEDKQLIKEAIEFGLRVAKMRNKERFTPKKYRRNKK